MEYIMDHNYLLGRKDKPKFALHPFPEKVVSVLLQSKDPRQGKVFLLFPASELDYWIKGLQKVKNNLMDAKSLQPKEAHA